MNPEPTGPESAAPPLLRMSAITLDCADPLALMAFYRQATGWLPHPKSDADFAALTREDGLVLGFQRAEGYQAPRWPGQTVPQQIHLDFDVADLAAAEARLLDLGAAKPDTQPFAPRISILTDPAGHPFCLIPRP